jgi:hypothetical protein
MKNKATTYVLLLAAFVVWGLLIYRVVQAYAGDETASALYQPPLKKEAYNDYAIKADTSRLKLNYRDPFGLAKTPDTSRKKTGPVVAIAALKRTEPAVDFGFIRYLGFIANPGSKKVISILQLNGASQMLADGESAGEVKLLKNLQDSVKISYHNHTKYIKKSSSPI